MRTWARVFVLVLGAPLFVVSALGLAETGNLRFVAGMLGGLMLITGLITDAVRRSRL